ncbi:hypothetical protein [Thermosynechococcus sp. TG252]|uniref:hypothetical protein n=1 Tax=Thermosynechococcus sp. TG252 TaxID=3074097 RepID=UPI00285B1267|nr:hypothetical protein [Thermosynechococcus sp. TG252]MDR7994347.1 hypothetical protein [Thermosynechococcus sp. TG252]
MQAKIILDFDHNLAELWFNGEPILAGHCELFPPGPYFSDGYWQLSPYVARVSELFYFTGGIRPFSQVDFVLCDPDYSFPIEEAKRVWATKPTPNPRLMALVAELLKRTDRDVLCFLQSRYSAEEIYKAMKRRDSDA